MMYYRVLFGVLAVMNTGLLGALVWLAMRHDAAVAAFAPVSVMAAWAAFLLGPWRPAETDAKRLVYVGEVSREGVRGFGLAPEVFWRWKEVDRVILTHIWYRERRWQEKRRIPTWALVQRRGEQIWVPRVAFSKGGWLLPQDFLRDRCGAEKVSRDDRLTPPDPWEHKVYPLWMGMAYLPLWPLLAETMHWPMLPGIFVVSALIAGLMGEGTWCWWTALAFLAQSVAGMWLLAAVPVEAAALIRQHWAIEAIVLAIGVGLLLSETLRRVE